MDSFEENQLRIYDLKEEKKLLKLEIDEEQYANTCLHRKRSSFSVSIIRNIIIVLYFLFLYGGIRFLVEITDIWEPVKENPVVQKLLELSDFTIGVIEWVLLLIIVIAVAFLIRKLYLIWLNSDNSTAMRLAEEKQRLTYNRQIEESNRKLAALLFHLQEIDAELEERMGSETVWEES